MKNLIIAVLTMAVVVTALFVYRESAGKNTIAMNLKDALLERGRLQKIEVELSSKNEALAVRLEAANQENVLLGNRVTELEAAKWELLQNSKSLRGQLAEIELVKKDLEGKAQVLESQIAESEAARQGLLFSNKQLVKSLESSESSRKEAEAQISRLKNELFQAVSKQVDRGIIAEIGAQYAPYAPYLEGLISYLEDLLVQGDISQSRVVVKAVLFIPTDLQISQATLDKDRVIIEKSLKIVQKWFLKEVGATFSLKGPIIVSGRNSAYYAAFDEHPEIITKLIYSELMSAGFGGKDTYFIVFPYGWDSLSSWGRYFELALISQRHRNFLGDPQPAKRYFQMAVLAHELGHVLGGLGHSPGGIMSEVVEGRKIPKISYFLPLFPGTNFTPQEREILRNFLKK